MSESIDIKRFMQIARHLFAFCLSAAPCFAAEIDSVTPRGLTLPDSVDRINEIVNLRIREGVSKANEPDVYLLVDEDFDLDDDEPSCDKGKLYDELRKALFQSYTASWGLKGYDLDKQLRVLLSEQSYRLPLNDSIYRDIDYLEGFSLNLKSLSDVVNINGYLVGLDKVGHFFAEGWDYFDISRDVDNDINDALAWGMEKEAGLFGYTTTGIYSYGDLVANFNGWRFWNRVLLEDKDPLKGMIGNLLTRAYVSCDIQILASIRNLRLVRAWEVNARFDLGDYVDGAWDEGNNCNSYADPIIEAKVESRINHAYPGFTCPFHPGACRAAKQRYGRYAKSVLHPYCLVSDRQ